MQIITRYAVNCMKLGGSDTEKALFVSFKYGGFAKHPLTSTDRLGNSKLPFPIAFAFGDSDWLGSDGADQIVKKNQFYEQGLSQLFQVD